MDFNEKAFELMRLVKNIVVSTDYCKAIELIIDMQEMYKEEEKQNITLLKEKAGGLW